MPYCPSCGAEVPTAANYCRACGASLDDGGDDRGQGTQARDGAVDETGVPGRGDPHPEPTNGRRQSGPADEPPRADDGGSPAESQPGAEPGPAGPADPGAGGGPVTRRRLLLGAGGVVGLVGVGGCLLTLATLGEPEHAVDGEAWDVTRTERRRSVTLTGTVTLPPGRYAARDLGPSVTVDYEVDFEVTAGGPVDVFTLEDDEYDRYRDRDDDFQYVADLSTTDAERGELRGSLVPGDYKLVFDNTGVYGADPDGEAELDVRVAGRV